MIIVGRNELSGSADGREWLARKSKELEQLSDAREQLRQSLGWTDLQRETNDVFDMEFDARLELVLCKPNSATETALRRDYFGSCSAFAEDRVMEDNIFVSAVFERLGVPLKAANTAWRT